MNGAPAMAFAAGRDVGTIPCMPFLQTVLLILQMLHIWSDPLNE
jgi:hypothetical protein